VQFFKQTQSRGKVELRKRTPKKSMTPKTRGSNLQKRKGEEGSRETRQKKLKPLEGGKEGEGRFLTQGGRKISD